MREYRVAEIFSSINGEAKRAGELALFVRFAGCNLNCTYCDTKWAMENMDSFPLMEKDALLKTIREKKIKNITLTGGEPLLQPGIEELIADILKDGMYRVEIETNGAVDIRPVKEYVCKAVGDADDRLCFTVDYKCPCSGMEELMCPENFSAVDGSDTVKFVVADMTDLEKMKCITEQYGLAGKCAVYISPVFGRIDPKDIVDFMLNNNMNDVRLQLQLHKYIWDPDKRGV
jgi:7-carboxy-7-deazaguanine synthase